MGGNFMHTFQPCPIDVFDTNPFTLIGKDWAVLTAGNQQKVNSMTISWGGFGVLWNKNVCFVFVRDSRYTKTLMDSCDTYSLTFFQKGFNRSILMYLGSVSGSRENKMQVAHLHVNYTDNIPFIDEGNLIIACKKLSATRITPDTFLDSSLESNYYKNGDLHTMYVGEILQVLAR